MTSEEIDKLRQSCSEISAMPSAGLIKRPEWGAIDFAESAVQIAIIQAAGKAAAELPDEWLSTPLADTLRPTLEAAQNVIRRLNHFRLSPDLPAAQQREQLINQVNNAYANVRDKVVPYVTTYGLLCSSEAPLVAPLRADQAEFLKRKAEALAEIDAALKEIEEAKTATKAASANAGVDVHSTAFEDEVRALETLGTRWLVVAGVLGGLAVTAALVMALEMPASKDAAWLVQYGLTKVFVVASLAGAALWCGSIYRALRHQITINRHRMNALRTFRAFVAAAETPEVRQAILMETTRAIFAGVPTGYLNATETTADGGGRLLEIAAKATKGSA